MAQQFIGLGSPNQQDGDFVRDAWVKAQDNFTELYGLQFFTDRIISGSATWTGTGLIFDVIIDIYVFNGEVLPLPNDDGTRSSINTQVTLSVGDATNPRIDVIALDAINNEIVVIPGDPSADPLEPTIDFETQLRITAVTVNANATTPNGVTSNIIYNEIGGEPNEWTALENTGGLRVNLLSNNNPGVGTVSIETTGILSGDTVTFVNDVPISTSSVSGITFKVLNKAVSSSLFQVQCFIGNTRASSRIRIFDNSYGYSQLNTSTYQTINISSLDLNFGEDQFDRIVITFFDRRFISVEDVFIDDVRFVTGVENPPTGPNGINLINATNDNGLGANTQVGSNIRDFYVFEDELVFQQGGLDGQYILQLSDTFKNSINIPTNTSSLINDGSDNTSTYVELDELSTVATTGSYNDLLNLPIIPTNTSDLINDGVDNTSTYVETDELGAVSFDNDYNSLDNLPIINSDIWRDVNELPASLGFNDLIKHGGDVIVASELGSIFEIGNGNTNGLVTFTPGGGNVTISQPNGSLIFSDQININDRIRFAATAFIESSNGQRALNIIEPFNNTLGVVSVGPNTSIPNSTNPFFFRINQNATYDNGAQASQELIGSLIDQNFTATTDTTTYNAFKLNPTFTDGGFNIIEKNGFVYETTALAASNHYAFKANVGKIRVEEYGSGNVTGTATFSLAVDTNGNIIETGIPLENIVEDLSPQLGNNLDLNGNSLIENGTTLNINIEADNTGTFSFFNVQHNATTYFNTTYSTSTADLTLGQSDTQRGRITLAGDSGNNGGELVLENSANDDINEERYRIRANADIISITNDAGTELLDVTRLGIAQTLQATIADIDSAGVKTLITKEWVDDQNFIKSTDNFTVATLPGSPTQGDRVYVTDANSTIFYSIVVGGGSNVVPVFYNGTNWVIG